MSDNKLFDLSYSRVFGEGVGISDNATPFFRSFYRKFLTDPEIANLFSQTDMTRQVGMLRKSFYHLVAFYVSHEPSGELERIARIHHNIGIDPRFYDSWLDALIETVREFDPRCDLSTELAWRWAMTPGLTYMRLLDQLGGSPNSDLV
ncbi:MAG: globin [Pseudomonadales bacterium]